MSRIFLSHSSANNIEAAALRDWLAAAGWDDVFVDFHISQGIAPGQRWEEALTKAANRCQAIVFLISKAWLNSSVCRREFNLGRRLNKRMFGVLIEDINADDLPTELTDTWQLVNIVQGVDGKLFPAELPDGTKSHATFSVSALARLRIGLTKAGLDPRFFAWPPETDPDRPPYRGLAPLEAEDAGIFFGREAEIIEALDDLRGLSEGAPPRMAVILGASGAGKSSFMRAGLWPRLKRDDRKFLPLPVIRPERAALSGGSGLVRSLEEVFKSVGAPRTRADIRRAVEGGIATFTSLVEELAGKAIPPALNGEIPLGPTLVFCIDQGEELFLSGGRSEAQTFQELLSHILKADAFGCLALVTIRSDAYENLQIAPAFQGIQQHTFSLPPLAKGAYREVIEGPARRLADTPRALRVEPALSAAILADIDAGGAKDALPLLAFTLERLYLDHGAKGNLALSDYETLGRIRGSIEAAVDRALKAADANRSIPHDQAAKLALLRRGLIPWLAGIDPETGSPRRRVAHLSEIPAEARPLIDCLVEARLLSTDVERATGELTIEPSHDALLRQWDLLNAWLSEDLGALTTLEGVKRAARDWNANSQRREWLVHSGVRLRIAELIAKRKDFAQTLTKVETAYIGACRRARIARTTVRAALIMGALLLAVGLWDYKGWHDIRGHLGESDYIGYLEMAPLGLFRKQAERHIQEAKDFKTIQEGNPEEYKRYAESHPNSSLGTFSRIVYERQIQSKQLKIVFPDSTYRDLTDQEVDALDCLDLRIARNEIYYRLGRCFTTEWGRKYFPDTDCKTAVNVAAVNSFVNERVNRLQDVNMRLLQGRYQRKQCKDQ